MLETTIKKVMWVGRATVFCVGLSVIGAVMLGGASAALAAVPGDPFRLGQLNAIDRISQLVGSTTSSMLRIDNNGTGSALQLLVEPERPPLTVNAAAGKATNLDADKLDGNDSAAFLQSSTPTYAVFDSSTGTEGFLAGASMASAPGTASSSPTLPGQGEVAMACLGLTPPTPMPAPPATR
jgi:hypothetical protein